MSEIWTPHQVAEELLRTFPILGRLMARMEHTENTDKTTFVQVRTLFMLMEEPITVSELAQKQQVSLQSVSVQVQGLVERGWVVRQPDPTDRRRSLLEVTPAGLAQAKATGERVLGYLSGVMAGLTPEETAAAQVFIPALKHLLMAQLSANGTDSSPDTGG